MVQEYVNDRSVAITVKTAKLTGRALAKALAATLRRMEKNRGRPKTGQQSMRRLVRDGRGTDNIEVMGRIQSFERIARKYKIAYHIERAGSSDPPKYTVYFKAAQKDTLAAAFKEYTELMLGSRDRQRKPSILQQLARIKEMLKNQAKDQVRNKAREGHEL